MVEVRHTYFTRETTTRQFLSDAELRADRNAIVEEVKENCDDCKIYGHLTNWGELVIKCASRKYTSLESAMDQEAVCNSAHKEVLESINGQVEVYLQDAEN